MKTRIGFVSNSSSSSFAIYKKHLTGMQLERIRNHYEVAKDDSWGVQESDDVIGASTWMDNFSMRQFLEEIGVKEEVIEWSDSPFLTGEDLKGITDCMEGDLIETLTDKIITYLVEKMSALQPWEREDIREIIRKEVTL